jgi:hypothetical protein
MSTLRPGVTGRKTLSEDDPIAALPLFVSIKRTSEVLCISRATVWRRIKDGTLQRVGTGKITKASIQRFAQPKEMAAGPENSDSLRGRS